MFRRFHAALLALGFLGFAVASDAQSIPPLINFQGVLSDANGASLATANYSLTFNIYSAPTGGTLVWGPQVFDGNVGVGHGAEVPVVNGHFNVILGPVDTNGNSIARAFSAGPAPSNSRYLEVTIGAGAPISPRQQVLATPYAINGVPAGSVLPFAGSTAPDGFLLCDGAAVSRATYSQLYSVLGVAYGAGDGSTTFNLPDIRGRVAVGAGAGPGLTARSRGQVLGEETHLQTLAEMAVHRHKTANSWHINAAGWELAGGHVNAANNMVANMCCGGGQVWSEAKDGFWSETVPPSGSQTAMNQMQPSLVLTFIIKY